MHRARLLVTPADSPRMATSPMPGNPTNALATPAAGAARAPRNERSPAAGLDAVHPGPPASRNTVSRRGHAAAVAGPIAAAETRSAAPRFMRMLALLVLAFFALHGAARLAASIWKPAHYHVQPLDHAVQAGLQQHSAPDHGSPRIKAGPAALPSADPAARSDGAANAHDRAHRHGPHGPHHDHGVAAVSTRGMPAGTAPSNDRTPAPDIGYHRHPTGHSGVVYLDHGPQPPLPGPRASGLAGADGWVPALYARRPWPEDASHEPWRNADVIMPLSWSDPPPTPPPWRAAAA